MISAAGSIYEKDVGLYDFLGHLYFYIRFLSLFVYFGGTFNKTILPLMLVGYELIIVNLALHTLLASYRLISDAPS